MNEGCKTCLSHNFDRLLNKNPLSPGDALEFENFFHRLINNGENKTTIEIQRVLHHKLRMLTGISDPYLNKKQQSNNVALELYREWKPRLIAAADPFFLALRLAIAGNIMDYGVHWVFDVNKTIDHVLETDFAIDHSVLLKQRIKEAKSILYLGDNAGEIVFDKLFIETIKHPNVTFAVKDGPILNDVTLQDAEDVRIYEVANVI